MSRSFYDKNNKSYSVIEGAVRGKMGELEVKCVLAMAADLYQLPFSYQWDLTSTSFTVHAIDNHGRSAGIERGKSLPPLLKKFYTGFDGSVHYKIVHKRKDREHPIQPTPSKIPLYIPNTDVPKTKRNRSKRNVGKSEGQRA